MSEKERVSAVGVNNTVNYKSNNVTNNIQVNNFNFNDSFLGSITMSLIDADHKKVEILLNLLHKTITNTNPGPQWKYDIKYEGEEIFLIEQPLSDEATKGLPEKMDVKLSIPHEYRHFQTIQDIINHGQRKQEIVKLEVKELKRYIGTHLVEHFKSQYDNNYILEIPPIPFPVTNAKMVFGDELTVDDINLQITEIIDDNRIRISNKNDINKKIFVEFIVNTETRYGESLKINLPENRYGNVESTLLREKILFMASKMTNLKLLFNDNLVMNGQINTADYDGSFEEIKLLEAIRKIEEEFNVVFILPQEIYQDDMNVISEIHHIQKYGVINGNVTSDFEFKCNDINGLRNMIQIDDEGNYCQVIKVCTNMMYVLFDKEICVGDEISIYPPMRLANRELLNRKIELFTDGDLLNVIYRIIDDARIVTIYKKFSSLNEEDFIKTQYLIRINEKVTIQERDKNVPD